MYSRLRSALVSPRTGLLVLLILILALTASAVSGRASKPGGQTVAVENVSYLDMVTFETGYTFAGTEVGGLSGIVYDAHRDVYYALSDDRSELAPSRYYTVDIDLHRRQLQVDFLDVTYLKDMDGDLFAPDAIDPESLELVRPGILYISTEGDDDTEPISDPFISRFNPTGRQLKLLSLPDKFLYSVAGNQVRDNLGFESLTASPDRHYLYAATENALLYDGPISTLESYSPSRFLQYDLRTRQPGPEVVYCVDPIPYAPIPEDSFADHGLVEIHALDNAGTFLTMERSFAVGVGNTIFLFEASTDGATDVSAIPALNLEGCPEGEVTPMSKVLVADFAALGIDPDNVEGFALGPTLPNGSQLLIAVSDNNFNNVQTTQFIALAIEFEAGD